MKHSTPKVLIVSSANMDFVMNVGTVPPAGATVIETGSYRYVPGGKGANSAIAFRRLGGDAVFFARRIASMTPPATSLLRPTT